MSLPSGDGVHVVTRDPPSLFWKCREWFLKALEEFDPDDWFDLLGEKQLADPKKVGELRRAMKLVLEWIDIVASKVTHKGKSPTDPKGKTRSGKRGQKLKYNAEADKKIYDAWNTGTYKTYAELALSMKITSKSIKHAIDRHRVSKRREN